MRNYVSNIYKIKNSQQLIEIIKITNFMMFTLIASRPKYYFTALSSLINQRVPLIDPEDGEKLDNHLNR